MSTTVEQSFAKQYEAEVHAAFQRMGSKLRNTVRSRNNVKGATVVFQKVGKGSAVTKARHGEIPPMNLSHTNVNVSLTDYFAGDYIDKFDELKVNHDERKVVANAGAFALGRVTDDLIFTAANTTTTSEAGSGLISVKRILKALELLRANDVAFDGELYGYLTPHAEAELLNTAAQFTNADYVGVGQMNSHLFQCAKMPVAQIR